MMSNYEECLAVMDRLFKKDCQFVLATFIIKTLLSELSILTMKTALSGLSLMAYPAR